MSDDNSQPSERASGRSRRFALLGLVGLIALGWLAVALSSLDGTHDWGDDWAQYAAQARGLAEGTVQQELELSRFRNQNSTVPFGPTVAPWGYPLVVAPAYALSGGDLASLKIPNCIFYALFLVAVFLLFEDRIDDVTRMLLVAAFALNPTLFWFQHQILSDTPFLFYSTASLLLIDRCILRRRFYFRPVVDLILLGAIISLACLTRTIGYLLLATVAAVQVIRWISERPGSFVQHVLDRRSEALVYGVALLGLAVAAALLPPPDVAASAQFAHLGIAGFGQTVANLAERIWDYVLLPSEFFRCQATTPAVDKGLAVFTVVFATIGAVRRFKRDAAFVTYCTLSLGVLILIGSFNGSRYFFPLLPFLLYFAVVGLTPRAQAGSGSSPKNWRAWPIGRIFAGVVVALFAFHLAVVFDRTPRVPRSFSPFGESGREMLSHIANETDESAVVIFSKPRAMTYLTGRRSIMVSQFDQVFDGRADYIVLGKRPASYQLPLRSPFWSKRRRDYEVAFQNRGFWIFDLRPGSAKRRESLPADLTVQPGGSVE